MSTPITSLVRKLLIGLALFGGLSCNLFSPNVYSGTVSITATLAAPANNSAPPTDPPRTLAPATSTTIVQVALASSFTPLPAASSIPSLTLVPLVVASTKVPPTARPQPTVSDPAGCQRPPDDYTRFRVNNFATINARTYAMLKHASDLYGGPINLMGGGITQGSYSPGLAASFGTHDGGGAVDISVPYLRNGVVQDDTLAALHALRVAGFAVWVRLPNELGPGSALHIHAIAIGDAELSPAARDQLTGQYGYFRGFDGIPQTNNIPIHDRYGGPILCQWMRNMGYRDLR